MTDAEKRLVADRGKRNSARGLFDQRLTRVKADLSARSVPARVKDRVQEQVFAALDQGIDIAKESKGIIAAVAGAMGLWFFRQPLIELAMSWFDRNDEQSGGETDEASQEEQQA